MVVWWCFCGGVFLMVWWCFCGGVFVVGVFVVVLRWWCCGGVFVGGVFVVVFLWWCGGVFVCFFCQGSTFVALPRSYAKSVDNTGVKDVWYTRSPYTAHIHTHIKHFLHLTVFIAFGISGV